MNQARLHGDIIFFADGLIEDLHIDSIYSRLIEKHGFVTTVYPDLIGEVGLDEDTYNFEHYFYRNHYEGNPPCISRVAINNAEQEVVITFSRVCSENFQYDIHTVIEVFGLHDYKVIFEGVVKDFSTN